MKKLQNAIVQAFLKARLEMIKLENDEEGMETLEVVILAAVAVAVAALIISALKGSDGLIAKIFKKVQDEIDKLFK